MQEGYNSLLKEALLMGFDQTPSQKFVQRPPMLVHVSSENRFLRPRRIGPRGKEIVDRLNP